MNEYDYVITKPEMEEVLYHAGFHKYVDKYLGKNGKWVYKYAGQTKGKLNNVANQASKVANSARTGLNALLPSLLRKTKGKYYSGKSKVQEQIAKVRRKKSGIKDASVISNTYKKKNWTGKGIGKITVKTGYKDTGRGRTLINNSSAGQKSSYEKGITNPYQKSNFTKSQGGYKKDIKTTKVKRKKK